MLPRDSAGACGAAGREAGRGGRERESGGPGALGPGTGLGAKEPAAGRGPLLGDGRFSTRWTWGVAPLLYGWGNRGPGRGGDDPGSRDRRESVSQLGSPALARTSSGSPGAPTLHPPTTPFQRWSPGAEGPENPAGAFSFWKAPWPCPQSLRLGFILLGGPSSPIGSREQSRGMGTPRQPLHVSSKQPGSSLWGLSPVGGPAPTASQRQASLPPPSSLRPRDPCSSRGPAANRMLGAVGRRAPLHPDLRPV